MATLHEHKQTVSRATRKRIRHHGARTNRSIAWSQPYAEYAEELADRHGLTVSGLIGMLLHDHALQDNPPRDLPFELVAR